VVKFEYTHETFGSKFNGTRSAFIPVNIKRDHRFRL